MESFLPRSVCLNIYECTVSSQMCMEKWKKPRCLSIKKKKQKWIVKNDWSAVHDWSIFSWELLCVLTFMHFTTAKTALQVLIFQKVGLFPEAVTTGRWVSAGTWARGFWVEMKSIEMKATSSEFWIQWCNHFILLRGSYDCSHAFRDL